MKRSVCVAIFSLVLCADATAEVAAKKNYSGVYLCKAIGSAGFYKDSNTGNWLPTTFKVEDVAHIIKMTDTGYVKDIDIVRETDRIYNVTVTDVAGDGKSLQCLDVDKNSSQVRTYFGFLSCGDLGKGYFFDFEGMKMQLIVDGSYMGSKGNDNSPFIELAKCQRID